MLTEMRSKKDSMDQSYQKADKIVVRKVVDETILVPISGNLANMQRIFALNPMGEFIWEKLDGQTSLKDIHISIRNYFEVDAAQAEKDLIDFIDELMTAGLII
jgi:hypothetical protein